jgi:hypothetical protein
MVDCATRRQIRLFPRLSKAPSFSPHGDYRSKPVTSEQPAHWSHFGSDLSLKQTPGDAVRRRATFLNWSFEHPFPFSAALPMEDDWLSTELGIRPDTGLSSIPTPT